MHLRITEILLDYLDFSLKIDPLSSEEYFTLLTQLLTNKDTVEDPGNYPPGLLAPSIMKSTKSKEKEQEPVSEDTKKHFRAVFSKIDGELVKLFELEKAKKNLGQDGFMPQLSAGTSLCRIVEIVSKMMNGKPALTQIVKENVRVVLKSLLKLKKLNLIKNR